MRYKYKEDEIRALINVVFDDLNERFKDKGDEWKLGYLSGLMRFESYLAKERK